MLIGHQVWVVVVEDARPHLVIAVEFQNLVVAAQPQEVAHSAKDFLGKSQQKSFKLIELFY
jgi:hypothetical protein